MQRGVRRGIAVVATALIGLFLTACLPSRTYTYRIESRGPVAADLGQFATHVASTLTDPRGWSLGGALRFEQVAGPSDFTVVLAAAGTLPSFGPPCSPEWSCQSGRNVIINETRWRTATSSWPYDLDSYQHYVVNHEVGHWLGFGHTACGGFGQRAPVMAQQSKGAAGGLGSCRFNVWPLPGERNQAGAVHRVAPAPPDLPTPDDPFGALDDIAVTRDEQGDPVSVSATGWALDGDTAGALTVLLVVDGRLVSQAIADRPRLDVATGFPRFGPARGYEVGADIPTTSVEACLVALGTGAGLPFQQLGCRTVK
jgi:hypothetical protein